jgi:hypothetical protein
MGVRSGWAAAVGRIGWRAGNGFPQPPLPFIRSRRHGTAEQESDRLCKFNNRRAPGDASHPQAPVRHGRG